MTTSPTASELTLLSSRLRVMATARIVMVAAVLVALASVPGVAAEGTAVLVWSSVAYVAVNATLLVVLGGRPGAARWLLDGTLVVDAAWAGVVLHATGGVASSFVFLAYLQLVAATVLFSWRSGVKLAILHTIAVAVLFYGQAVGFAQDVSAGSDVTVGPFRIQLDPTLPVSDAYAQVLRLQAILVAVTVWVMTGATAFFSRVNERALRQSNRELAVLRELSIQLERSLDLGEICAAIASGTVEELGYRRAVVWMSAGTGLVPAGAAGVGPGDHERLAGLRLHPGGGPVGTAIESRRPTLVARDDPRPPGLAEAFDADSPLVLVPLQTEGRVLGLVAVELGQPVGRAPRLRGRDLRILATLATEASLALENARLHAELRDLAITDALTGVYNHRHFQQRLQEELDRAARLSTLDIPRPVSLVLVDVDHFKAVNDRYGHQAGDDILRTLARLMGRVLRSSDVTCRYGGEEFAVVLPETDAEAAVHVAGRLREAIERSSFTASDGRELGGVTASFGVATFDGGIPSRSDLIRQADEALYAAKHAGRNRVVHAHDAPPGAVLEAAEPVPAR